MALAEKVRVKREEKRLTQAELAKMAGVTQATVSRVESGEITQLKSNAIAGIAKALDVSVEFLVGSRSRMTFDETLEADGTAQAIFRGYEKLPEERKKQVREYVDFLLRENKSR